MFIQPRTMNYIAKDLGITLLSAGIPSYLYLTNFNPVFTFGAAFLGFMCMTFKVIHDFNKYIRIPYLEYKANKKGKKG